ncbi:uncharacterized protein FOMMEDRAFT_158864 [Fomitiporia mediterranea MF3/22]|uniref:uncharacterized protein n=1 Tax=Fomitiporia mediterranea (strain MF3/22) TaxID=694068 RepID=UPI0004408373|nr:uncharacterized protein FOMMEDRAFT_158864 [Fomitiporia mediterranea MF3/22]EJD01710.1 hypothetical protein FOMMEDRAFT_158864 [Fomitiporia mediterranea MF3/22]
MTSIRSGPADPDPRSCERVYFKVASSVVTSIQVHSWLVLHDGGPWNTAEGRVRRTSRDNTGLVRLSQEQQNPKNTKRIIPPDRSKIWYIKVSDARCVSAIRHSVMVIILHKEMQSTNGFPALRSHTQILTVQGASSYASQSTIFSSAHGRL